MIRLSKLVGLQRAESLAEMWGFSHFSTNPLLNICRMLKSIALNLGKFIKAQKSRRLLEKLIDKEFVPSGKLAQLVRVPHVRD